MTDAVCQTHPWSMQPADRCFECSVKLTTEPEKKRRRLAQYETGSGFHFWKETEQKKRARSASSVATRNRYRSIKKAT